MYLCFTKQKEKQLIKTNMKTKEIIAVADSEDRIFLVNIEEIETTNLCECKDEYGMCKDCEHAGCDSITNSYSDGLREDCLEFFGFSKNEDFDEIYRENRENFDEWNEENAVHEEVDAINFYDGRNFRSLILDVDFFYLDEDLEKDILKNYIKKREISEENETKTYGTKKYEFVFFKFSSDPWICEVLEK